jgi:arginase
MVRIHTPLVLIKAPLVAEEYFSGVSLMADVLIKAGLGHALSAQVVTELPPPDWEPRRDPTTKILNPHEVRGYSIDIADAVQKQLKTGHFPVVLGGDCSILIGSMLGLKREGTSGLFFIDGHADFYQPEVSPSGEIADMELSFVVGRGPEMLVNIENQGPLVEESYTVLFGFRDEEIIRESGGQDIRATKIFCVSLADTRYYGFNNVLEKSICHITSQLDKFWVHLDLDVLDDTVMPAVDYRMPDGLSNGELVNVLRRLMKTGRIAGISVAIFNPTLDWDGTIAETVVALLHAGLIPS